MSARVTGVDPITLALEGIRDECAAAASAGTLADYIPELARADPGIRHRAGQPRRDVVFRRDAAAQFTIQSVSKPFVYALALADLGFEAVRSASGPSPAASRSTPSASTGHGSPRQPDGQRGRDRHDVAGRRATSTASARACRRSPAARSASTRRSTPRSPTGDRNRAIAHLMRAAGSLHADVDATSTSTSASARSS